MTDEQESQPIAERSVQRWSAWVERITHDVMVSVSDRRSWTEANEMWRRNRSLRVPGDAADWIARMHADSAALAVRRQLDRSSQSVSLWRLLDELERRARFMTLDAHLRGVEDEWHRARIAVSAQEWVEPGTSHLDPAIPAEDRSALEAGGRLAKEWANKVAAHADEKGARHEVTYGDLHRALDIVQDLAVKYSLIVNCVGYPTDTQLLPRRQFDESLFFRRAWHKPFWRKRVWPEGWVERHGDLEPSIDTLSRANYGHLLAARHAIVSSLRECWNRDRPDESPIRGVLEGLGLPASDAAVLWVRDRLLQRGYMWNAAHDDE